MSEKEEKKYEAIKNVIDGLMTKDEAEIELKLGRKQINRLIKLYNEEGENGFIHKGKGNTNAVKIDDKIKIEIVNLYLEEYYDYNISHFFQDAVENKYPISFPMLKIVLKESDIISPMAHHDTKNEYNKKMREELKSKTLSEDKKELYESRLLREEQAHTRKSSLFYKFGEEIQMDASEYMWFGDMITHLHLVVDKATKIVLFGWFDYEETMRAYFVLLFNVIYLYGIPRKIRTDKRKVFDSDNREQTHFGRACCELKIELLCSSNPRFKPNVERENYTFENRLKAELRHENITTIKDANKYLNDVFIPKMNERFAHKIDSTKTLMRENSYSIEELSLIISERYQRIVDTGSCIKYMNKYYNLL